MDTRKNLALKRVKILLNEAEEAFSDNPSRSHQYVRQARKIAMKVRLKLPRQLKRKFCHHCYHFLKPGVNCRVRVKDKMLIAYCRDCRRYNKYGF